MLTENTISLINNIYLQDEYRHVYCEKISELHQSSIDSSEKAILDLLCRLQRLHLRSDDKDNPYVPMAKLSDETTTFQINEFSENDVTVLQSLDLELLPLMLQARVSDVLWVLKKDHKMAERAFSWYMLLGKMYLAKSERFYHGVEYVERAMYISQQLGKRNFTHKRWFEETEKVLISVSPGNNTWIPNKLILFLLMPCYKEYCLEANKKLYVGTLEAQIEGWGNSIVNVNFVESAFSTLKSIYKGNNEKIKEYDLKLAALYKDYSQQFDDINSSRIFAAIKMLNAARNIYQKYFMTDEVREIVDLVTPMQQKSLSFMVPFSHLVDISELVGEFPSILEAISKDEKLDFVAEMTLFYQKDRAIETVKNKKNHSVFADLVTKQLLNERGEVEIILPPLTDDVDVVILHAYRNVTQFELPFIAHYLAIILHDIKNEKWEESDFDYLFNDNWLIPEDVTDSIKKGFILGFSGDVNAAASYFLSSIEPIVRNYVNACDGVITLLREDGATELKTLGSLLKDEKFADKCDENILFTFEAFFNSKAGTNLKNNFSHGRNNWQKDTMANTYLLCLILKLCCMSSIEGCARNVKIKKNPHLLRANEVWAKKTSFHVGEEP